MPRLFSDLVVSRSGAPALNPGLALPASLVLHAAAATLVVFVAVLRQDTLPRVEMRPGRIPDFVALPPAGGGDAIRPAPPRPLRPMPRRSMAFVPELPPLPENQGLDVPTLESDIDPVGGPPCLIGCDRGGVPGGDPDGGVLGAGLPSPVPAEPIRTGIDPPLKVRHVFPAYPEVARAARVQGDVVLDCTISNDGRVVDVKILSGPILLQPAAVDAVRQWRYRPTLLNGIPVPVLMTVTVHFTIDRSR
jgi:protein TonB